MLRRSLVAMHVSRFSIALTGLLAVSLHTTASAGSLSVEAHEIGTADGTVNRWYVDWDTFSRDFMRRKKLQITVRDFSRKVQSVTVHVYFIGHPMGNAEPLFVYGHATIPVELHGNLEVKGAVDAPPIKARMTKIDGFEHVAGVDIDGWIVIGEYEGKPFQVRASRQKLLDLAEKERPTLDAMVAEYEETRPRRR